MPAAVDVELSKMFSKCTFDTCTFKIWYHHNFGGSASSSCPRCKILLPLELGKVKPELPREASLDGTRCFFHVGICQPAGHSLSVLILMQQPRRIKGRLLRRPRFTSIRPSLISFFQGFRPFRRIPAKLLLLRFKGEEIYMSRSPVLYLKRQFLPLQDILTASGKVQCHAAMPYLLLGRVSAHLCSLGSITRSI